MNTFEQVKAQIKALPHSEYMRLVEWFSKLEADEWDREIERDSEAGALDFLIDEALAEKRDGKLRQIG